MGPLSLIGTAPNCPRQRRSNSMPVDDPRLPTEARWRSLNLGILKLVPAP